MKENVFVVVSMIQLAGFMFGITNTVVSGGCVYKNWVQGTNPGYLLGCEVSRNRFWYDPDQLSKDRCGRENDAIRADLLDLGLKMNELERKCKLDR